MSHIVRYALEGPGGARTALSTRIAWRCVLLAMLSCTASSSAPAQSIYKCVDASGRITYQSSACSNGAAIDIAPGAYDPAAAARLREDAEAWTRRDDARRALAAREDAQRERDAAATAAARAAASEPAPAYAATCDYCDNWASTVVWPYPPWAVRPPHRPLPRPHPLPRPPPAPYRIVIR